jgi:hypothetical protein
LRRSFNGRHRRQRIAEQREEGPKGTRPLYWCGNRGATIEHDVSIAARKIS